MNPDAATRASGDTIETDLASLQPDQRRLLHWHGLPVFVVLCTAATIDSLRDEKLLAVLVGVCAYCACVSRRLRSYGA